MLYFNRVHHTQHWYTPSAKTIVMEVKHVLRTGLQVQPTSAAKVLPHTCARIEATRKKAVKVSSLDHKAIMEKVSKRDRLEYDNNSINGDDDDNNDKSNEESNEKSKKNESESESK